MLFRPSMSQTIANTVPHLPPLTYDQELFHHQLAEKRGRANIYSAIKIARRSVQAGRAATLPVFILDDLSIDTQYPYKRISVRAMTLQASQAQVCTFNHRQCRCLKEGYIRDRKRSGSITTTRRLGPAAIRSSVMTEGRQYPRKAVCLVKA